MYGTSAQPESHFTCSSPRCTPRVVPSMFLILRGPGEERWGAPGTVPLQNQEVTSRKASLRNAEKTEKRRQRGVEDVANEGASKTAFVRGQESCLGHFP